MLCLVMMTSRATGLLATSDALLSSAARKQCTAKLTSIRTGAHADFWATKRACRYQSQRISGASSFATPGICRFEQRRSGAICAAMGELKDCVVSTSWLADNLEDVTVLDVRGKVEQEEVEPGVERSTYLDSYSDYISGHIPGASFVSWLTDGVDGADAVPAQITTDHDIFCACMEEKGVASDRPVVVYDAGDCLLAPRLWWALTYHGHQQVLVLDGGYRKWEAEGRETTSAEPCPLKVYADFSAEHCTELRVSAEEVANMVETRQVELGDAVLIDARDSAQYNGTKRRSKHAGRIPGAVSLPRKALLDPDTGMLLPLDEQRAVLEGAGLDLIATSQAWRRRRFVAYCNGGVASATILLTLHRLGVRDYANYDGSWNEWGNRDNVPIEKHQ